MSTPDGRLASLRGWATGPGRVPAAVAAIALVGLLARVVWLGGRPAHFDEARVAYWSLQYAETGVVRYRYIVHGPLVQHLTSPLFVLLGPTDFSARLPVAVAGGLLPLAALLFRRSLSDVETVAVAVFLAANPLLVYYSRFYRSSLLVAGFALVAFGCLVRLAASRRPRYLYGVAVLLALAFAAKENAAVYVLCWLGAGALLADHALHEPRGHASGLARVRAITGRVRDVPPERALRWLGRGVLAAALFVAIAFVFYAPRDPNGLGLWSALASPGQLPALVDATLEDVATGYGYWFGGSAEPGCNKETLVAGYVCFLERAVSDLGRYAAPVVALAGLGFVHERYAREDARPVVVAAGLWGFVSILGYPLGTDIWGSWVLVNVVVPLVIPAAVGVALLVETGREALAEGDRQSAAMAAGLVVVAGAWTGAVVATDVYGDPAGADNPIVQYAQPSSDLRAVVTATRDRTGGPPPHVLVYGASLVDGDESAERTPACLSWFDTLPLPWYLEAADASVTCAAAPADLPAEYPPVVVAQASQADDVRPRLEEYESVTATLRRGARPVVVFYEAEPRPGRSEGT
jgi:uncharacterized protein (TIGR03663 family)